MASRILLSIVTSLCCAGGMVFSLPVGAETPLTQATIQRLKAKVELHLKQKGIKPAQKADVMTPGDALRTFRQAMAELRFNDRSLARVGEQAIFQFEPNSRNFDLQKGTVLLLIQPGQGKTRVRTPNAAAGIRGSALFMRYIEDSKVTVIGALTNSDIEVSNNNGKSVVLKAGQLAYVYKDQIGVYNFDQKLFQETSPFFKEIDWNEAPADVKVEIQAALEGQQTVAGKFEDSPAWTKLAENRPNAAPLATYATQRPLLTERTQESVFPNREPSSSVATVIPTASTIPETAVNQPPVQPTTSASFTPPAPENPPAPLPDVRPNPDIRPSPVTETAPPQVTTPNIPQPSTPTPPVVITPTVPTTPPITTPANQTPQPPASNLPSATNPPTRPVASPQPVTTPPVVSRPTPVVTPPQPVATPAIPANQTPGQNTPAIPAVPPPQAIPPIVQTPNIATPTPPTPVAPAAPPIVPSAPVAASVPPPPVAAPPAAPPTIATPPTPPPSVQAAPTPPATAPSDLPTVQAVTTTITVTPPVETTPPTPAATPVEKAPETITTPSRSAP